MAVFMENPRIQPSFDRAEVRNLSSLKERVNSRVHSPDQIKQIEKSILQFGWTTPVLIDEDDVIVAGYGRVAAARNLSLSECPVIVARGWTEAQKRAYLIADNQIAINAGWDERLLRVELHELQLLEFDISLIGFSDKEVSNLFEFGTTTRPIGNLADQFMVAPFSILDARTGWWQERKRGWLALGIQSELGRGENALRFSQTILQPDPKKRQNAHGQNPHG